MNTQTDTFLLFGNKGQAIAYTNYWDSEQAKAGFAYLSWNAGAARLLVPDSIKHYIREMKTGKYVVLSRGKWLDQGEIVQVKREQPHVFYASIFNATQMENVPEYKPPTLQWKPEEAAENILIVSGAAIFYDKSDTAYYSQQADQIHMPPKVIFPNPEAFYGVALHELGHWTGHASRLNRDLVNSFGSSGYAKEELRAELASYFLQARLGIPHDTGQHASYVQSWIQALQQDHNEIFRAAKDAEKICEFVMDFQQEKITEKETSDIAEEKIVLEEQITKPKRARKPVKEMEMEC